MHSKVTHRVELTISLDELEMETLRELAINSGSNFGSHLADEIMDAEQEVLRITEALNEQGVNVRNQSKPLNHKAERV